MFTGSDFRKRREELGLTQTELSRHSGVSLPFIQNIERGIANPSIKIVVALFDVLGVRLRCEVSEPDWPLLNLCGVPLRTFGTKAKRRPTADNLIQNLRKACAHLR